MAAKKSVAVKLGSAWAKRQTAEDLARFPEENPNPVMRADNDGTLIYANRGSKALLQTLGWRTGEMLPAAIWEQIVAGAVARTEFDLPVDDHVYAVAASHGVADRDFNLYFRNVTVRKQAVEALRHLNAELERRVAEQTSKIRQSYETAKAERQRLYDVLNTLPVYVILLAPDYHVPFANRFFEERFGKSAGRQCFEYLFDRTEPCENCETFKVFETRAAHHWEWTGPDDRNYDIYDFPFTDSDGSPLIMEVGIDVTAVHKARAALEHANRTLEHRVEKRTAELAKANDRLRIEIDERRKAEADLLEAKEDWERTFNTVPDLIAILDAQHRIKRVNRTMAQKLGMEAEQCVGLSCFQCVHGLDEPPECCPHVCTIADGREHTAELHENLLGGDFLVTTTPMFDAAGKLVGAVHTARDITERKQAEQAMRELNETLEQQVADRTAVAEQRAEHLRRLAAELSQTEHRERKRLAAILHDDLQQLLLAARLRLAGMGRSSKGSLQTEVEAVDALLDECLGALRDLTMELSPPILHRGTLGEVFQWLGDWFGEKHGLIVTVDAQETFPSVPEHIQVFLFHAVRELLFNTVKHSGKMEARVSLSFQEGCLKVHVEDCGRGLDPKVILQNINRAKSLGLFNIQERLEALEGRLEVESKPHGGACFRLIVPMRAVKEPLPGQIPLASADAPRSTAKDPRSEADTIRLLVVDDHKVVREGFVGLLSREPDFVVVGQASDGQQAVRQAEALQPDVIVMDVEMPIMDGIEATRQIKQRRPHIQVVGLSLHEEESVARAITEAGAAMHLSKHAPAEELIAAIRRTFGRESTPSRSPKPTAPRGGSVRRHS